MKIYTKTGDKGMSGLYNGERREKDDIIFEALGATDELSSHLGLAREYCDDMEEQDIQCWLQDAGSNIATPREHSNEARLARTEFDLTPVNELERWIDAMDEKLPQLTQFILPSGGHASAHLHVARSVCRRAERRLQPLIRERLCDDSVGIFLNRLSDYLFEAARYMTMRQGKTEKIYKKQP
ncbi:hypothetical protein DFQ29_000328 [Apophysomyces sp. BC1021]|nr:hypothetical protein DFQ29_000328 [Apophysomyces sp. BC1021]